MKNSHKRKVKQRKRLWDEQEGKCYWCKEQTFLLAPGHSGKVPARAATLDHLESRHNSLRGMFAGSQRHVMACYHCNQKRNNEELKNMSIEELHRRSKRGSELSL